MTRPAADSVKVEWSGTGTGTMSLGSNVSGFASFPASANGLPVSYEIAHQTAAERENGLGTYTSAGNTLSRDLVTFSTAGAPTKVTFSAGVKHVRLTALASDVVENRATTDPTANDGLAAGYVAGRSRWLNTAANKLWFCIDDSVGSPGAVWVQVGGGGAISFPISVNNVLFNDMINAGDANFTYNYATHGTPFRIIAYSQTEPRTWTFDIDQGPNSVAFGRLINDSASENITVNLEDVGQPATYVSETLPPKYVAFIEKRSNGQWLISGKAARALGVVAGNIQPSQILIPSQWRVVAEIAGDGVAGAVHFGNFTEQLTPAAGDLFWMQRTSDGAWRRVPFSSISNTAAAPGVTTATPTGGIYTLSNSVRFYPEHRVLNANAAVDIEVPAASGAGNLWKVHVTTSNAVSVSVVGDAGSVNSVSGGSVTAAGNGATLWIFVLSNAGSAPVVIVEGETGETRTLAGDVDGAKWRIYRYHQKKYNNQSGNKTLNEATYDAGSTVVNSGAAATYTVPSRLSSGGTAGTVQLVIHNRGSGAITLSASGVTIKGSTSIPVDASATLEWEHDGTTERVWIRSTA